VAKRSLATASLLAILAGAALVAKDAASLPLTPPERSGGAALAEALWARRTARNLAGPGLSLAEASRLLWAAQGENRPGRRVAPSARAKYPLELYLLTTGSQTLPAGVYHYLPAGHRLERVGEGSPLLLNQVKGMQAWIAAAPAVFLVAGVPARLGAGGEQPLCLTYYEAGEAAQGLLLQASALGLGAGTATGVDLEAAGRLLSLPSGQRALAVLPVGRENK
jgi:SagB-type dehydrogenase family enzyme